MVHASYKYKHDFLFHRSDAGDGVTEHNYHNETISAEAAEWIVRRGSSGFSESDEQRLQAWRQQSPDHEAAYQTASLTWLEMGKLTKSAVKSDDSASRSADQQGTGIVDIATTPTRCGPMDVAPGGINPRERLLHRAHSNPWWFSAAASLLITILAGVWYTHQRNELSTLAYHAEKGETVIAQLPDGSTADLNTASTITTHYSKYERRVELDEGEAVFTVVPEPGPDKLRRPFIVTAGGGEIRALGTEFSVQRIGNSVKVTVYEHSVKISLAPDLISAAPRILSAGESVQYTFDSGFSKVEQVNLTHAAAWRHGQLIFDRVPLKEVLAEINRYRNEQIILRNRSLADREVSGVFQIDDLEGAVNTIALGMNADISTVSSTVKAIQ